jgi:putative CocE/NonD family hydrolase
MRLVGIWLAISGVAAADEASSREEFIRSHYTKYELRIPMRDGVRLFTSVYVPNRLPTEPPTDGYPIMMVRTPYSAGPYGAANYRGMLGPSADFERSGYIFVYQDVRGRYLSEGDFVNMRPHLPSKRGPQDIDESTDTFDTIEWLVRHVPGNNGCVGQWGISYPGFYTSAGVIDSHPALKAVSPQAPIADWFFDDFHRNGAFVPTMAVNFFSSFGRSRPQPSAVRPPSLDFGTRDGYQFFLDLGPLNNVNERYFKGEIAFWNEMTAHPNYDAFWQSRNILPHLRNISAAVLTVGGWFDTEDLYGPLQTYRSIEQLNPGISNRLVMGPWYHGQWNRDDGQSLGEAEFGFATAQWYRDQVQFPFFEHHLKGSGQLHLPEAIMFETGSNRWQTFDRWPPAEVTPVDLYIADSGRLDRASPTAQSEDPLELADSFPSDPAKPIPYTQEITTRWARDYVTEDQRFAAWRPDCLVYSGPPLTEDLTVAGPIEVDLWVSSTASDADWIVKLIDAYPGQPLDGYPGGADFPAHRQQLVRAGVLRGRFRESFEEPIPMEPNRPVRIRFSLDDVLHTFASGHRVMIHIQSSWFPFIDRNPQRFVPNIFEAQAEDFIAATHRVHRSRQLPSHIRLPVLKRWAD